MLAETVLFKGLPGWGLGICFRDGSLTWLLAGGLSLSLHEPLHSSLSAFISQQLASSRASDPREKEQGRKATMSCRDLEVRLYSIDHMDQPWYLWEGTTQGQEYQRQGSLGSTLKSGYHSSLAFHPLTFLFSFPVDTLVRLLRARLRESVWSWFSGGLVYASWECVEVMG